MILLPQSYRRALRAAAIVRRTARDNGTAEPDPAPSVKFFNPVGAATWLATELDEDGDSLFGLADLGFGCPELGSFSLRELQDLRLPFGLGIERDLTFSTTYPLSIWAAIAHREGSISEAEHLLASAPLPTAPNKGGG